ncbi:MAG: DUF2520 domain-containing protein [Alistipes sp.]|nr:DUF2520 domain-containing protein [Alistipes sp.]
MSNSVQPLRVVVVGSGNVAEAVAIAVADTWALELKQVVARNTQRAAAIAEMCRTDWCDDLSKCEEADFYIIAVSDRAVEEVASQLNCAEGAIVVHTAGSVEMEALGECARGVLYPFQTFTMGRKVDFSDVPLFVEGCSEEVTERIESLAQLLSRRVYRANSSRRREIHLAGVLACNFVNALYSMAADHIDSTEALPFDVLRPLILETARKASESSHPRLVQTGPAVRGDFAVAERHQGMLDDTTHKEIYKLLTDYIWQTSKKI